MQRNDQRRDCKVVLKVTALGVGTPKAFTRLMGVAPGLLSSVGVVSVKQDLDR